MTRRGAALAVLAGAAAWGTTGTSQAVADLDVAPTLVGAARLVAGAAALWLLVAVRGGLRLPQGRQPAVRRRPAAALLVAALAMTTYQLTFFGAVDRAGVAIGTVVGIGSAPVLTGLVAWLVDRVVPSGRWWVATGLAVIGCVLVVVPASGDGAVDPVGVGLALVAGLAYAVLVVAQQRVAGDAGPLRAVAAMLALAAVPGAVVLLAGDAGALLTGRGLLLVLWLGVVTVAVGHGLWSLGLAHLPAPSVGTLTLAEPLVAAVLGMALLGERPTAAALAGAGLLVLGLVLVTLPRRRVVGTAAVAGGDPGA